MYEEKLDGSTLSSIQKTKEEKVAIVNVYIASYICYCFKSYEFNVKEGWTLTKNESDVYHHSSINNLPQCSGPWCRLSSVPF